LSRASGDFNQVDFSEFLYELENELKFHKNGGTSYRHKTAELSLEVAKKVGMLLPFNNLGTAKKLVKNFDNSLDNFRVDDVAKMLNVVAKDLQLKANMSEELSNYVRANRKKRKPLSFKVKQH